MLDIPISDIILKIPISVQNLIQRIYTSNQWGLGSLPGWVFLPWINVSRKKKDCLAYSTDQDNKSNQIFITSLASNSEERFQFKQTFGFSRPYSVAHEIDQSQ